MIRIFPSLISADLLNLQKELSLLDPVCDGYHLDVMDGHFVRNITWGPSFINHIAKATTKPCWVHLMTTDPHQWINRIELKQNSMVDFHYETVKNHRELLDLIKQKRLRAGIALSPETDIEMVQSLLQHVDYTLVMSVNPGFSGQTFIPKSLEKIKKLAQIKYEKKYQFEICVDGGINTANIKEVITSGATIVAAASAIFAKTDYIQAIETLKNKSQ